MRILVVDDDISVRAYVVTLLNGLGVTSVVADGLDKAIHELATNDFDGAILDLVVLDGNGVDVAKAASAIGVPVVFSSAVTDEHNLSLMYEHGWVVPKPMRLAGLKRIIEHFKIMKHCNATI